MIVSISGTGPRNAKKLEQAARFFAAFLLHVRTVNNIELEIDVIKTLKVEGECVSEDDHKNPRYFTINLKAAPIEEMIKVLSHEMVHLKQYAKNELGRTWSVARGGKGLQIITSWQGKLWYPKKKEDPYWDAPWEVDAYGMEVGLQYKWVTRHDPKMPWYVGA